MLEDFWSECTRWWSTVPPEFAFLLVLPFIIAFLGLLAEGIRSARGRT